MVLDLEEMKNSFEYFFIVPSFLKKEKLKNYENKFKYFQFIFLQNFLFPTNILMNQSEKCFLFERISNILFITFKKA